MIAIHNTHLERLQTECFMLPEVSLLVGTTENR